MMNFAHRLGITQKRIEQIGEMAKQTFDTGFDMTKQAEKNGGKYDKTFEEISKLIREDIKLLNGIEEGIVYGYRISELIREFTDNIKRKELFGASTVTVVDLNDLIDALTKNKRTKR
jgi:hypothetical protein